MDRRAQLGFALRIVAPVAVVSALSTVAVLLFLRRDDMTIVHVADLQRFLIIANVVYFVLLIGVLTVAALLLTHRWAGAAFVLKNAIDGMREGDHGRRLKLRRTDYLQDVASRLSDLRDDLVRDRQMLEEALARVDAALARGDADEAADLLRALPGRVLAPEAVGRDTIKSREPSASPAS